MYLACFQSLQWLIANSVIIMTGKGPFLVEAWAPWKIWGRHLPTPAPHQMAPLVKNIRNLRINLRNKLLYPYIFIMYMRGFVPSLIPRSLH